MKTKFLTYILALSFISITGCNSNDDNSNNISDPLHGEWKLTSINAIISTNLDNETIKFIFDTDNLIVTVENNDESILFSPNSGTYPYSIVNYEGDDYIIIEGDVSYSTQNGNYRGFKVIWSESESWFKLDLGWQLINGTANYGTDQPEWLFER